MKLKNILLCPSNVGQLKKGVKNFPKIIKNHIKSDFKTSKVNINYQNNIFYNSNQIYKESLKNNYNICIEIGRAHV